jgi:hypothetical protein
MHPLVSTLVIICRVDQPQQCPFMKVVSQRALLTLRVSGEFWEGLLLEGLFSEYVAKLVSIEWGSLAALL